MKEFLKKWKKYFNIKKFINRLYYGRDRRKKDFNKVYSRLLKKPKII